jgi:hypothetical protein
MDTGALTVGEQGLAYVIGGRRVAATDAEFANVISEAHQRHERPRCPCRADGPPMYVARLGHSFIVKRMPHTGHRHAAHCRSHGSIQVQPIHCEPARPPNGDAAGCAGDLLELGFSLSASVGQATGRPSRDARWNSTNRGLSLESLLCLLWERAGLTAWHPGFAGKRNWAVVRWRLLQAAGQLRLRSGDPLASRLYIPEVFSVKHAEAIAQRRIMRWADLSDHGHGHRLMLMIAELKAVRRANTGFEVLVKHLPGLAFGCQDVAYTLICRGIEQPFDTAATSSAFRQVIMGTVAVGTSGTTTIRELAQVTLNGDWLPTSAR